MRRPPPTGLAIASLIAGAAMGCSGPTAGGCAKAKAAIHSLAPTMDGVRAGTKGAADLDTPLASTVVDLHAAAADATGSRAADMIQAADDFSHFRTDLASARSWSDPRLQADVTQTTHDIDIVDADCKS